MNINAKAVFFATQAVLPTMIAQKSAIVNLASMAGKVGSKTNLPYNVSKAAVISMTKSLALAHGADGIRVNWGLAPHGFVETDMGRRRSEGPGRPARHERRRIHAAAQEHGAARTHGNAEDVASVIGFPRVAARRLRSPARP